MNDDLKGRIVLVRPGLTYDPAGMQNQIGVIKEADLMNDDIFVSFDGLPALYASEALLVFLDMQEIHQNLADMAYETPFADLKALTQIDLFFRYGNGDKERVAMNIARSNPAIQCLCLESLNAQIYKDISKSYGRE